MKPDTLLADSSRRFLQKHKQTRYRMKKISEMDERDVISACHCFCEENHLTSEWRAFRAEVEAGYRYCDYFEEYIEDGECVDLQMIAYGFIQPSVLPERSIERSAAAHVCETCKYRI